MRNTSLALIAVLVAGISAPAFAAGSADDTAFDNAHYVAALNERGIDALSVEQNGNGTITATVLNQNGSQSFAYFDADSLTPIGVTGGIAGKARPAQETRVLTKVDTGLKATPVSDYRPSYLEDHFFDDDN